MGIWDEYCLICGGPLWNNFIKGKDMYDEHTGLSHSIIKKDYNWLNDLYLILSSGLIISTTVDNHYESGEFKIKGKKYVITPLNYHNSNAGDDYGIVCHRDCYKLLSDKLNYELRFNNICRLLDTGNSLIKNKSGYGVMVKYQSQFFNYYDAHTQNAWLLESPLKNKKNMERILKMWGKIVNRIKKK